MEVVLTIQFYTQFLKNYNGFNLAQMSFKPFAQEVIYYFKQIFPKWHRTNCSFPKLFSLYNYHRSPHTPLPPILLSQSLEEDISPSSATFQPMCTHWDRSSYHKKLLYLLNISYVYAVLMELKILVILKKWYLFSFSLNDVCQEQILWFLFIILQLCCTICFSQS